MASIEKFCPPGEFFGVRGPASTMVEVSALAHPDYLIEVEAIAVI
jgi:enamine deaminase RidA (YjgF/YER057c/UK114 family)